MSRPRIAVITACWKRPEVFRLFAANMLSLNPSPPVICAGSPGDDCGEIATWSGMEYAQVPNVVARKWNHACAMAAKVKADRYLFMGADDLMDQRCWSYYQKYAGQHLALRDYYFHHLHMGHTLYWPGYETERKGEPIGAAKLVSRDVMERIDWRPFKDDRHHSLDYDMHHRMLGAGVKMDVVPMYRTGGVSLDVKTGANLTPWDVIAEMKHVRYVDLAKLSPQLWKLLRMPAL